MAVKIREKIKGSGEYWIFINHRGARKAKKIGDKKTALKTAKAIEAKLVLGDLDVEDFNKTVPSFKDYAKKWLALPHNRKSTTQQSFIRNLERHVYPVIGNTPVDKIKRRDLKSLFDGLLMGGMHTSNIQNIKAPLNHIFNNGVVDEYINTNPLNGLSYSAKAKTKIQPVDDEEAFKLLDAAKEYRGGMFYPHLLTLLRTGVRIGEFCGLKWQDVDFDNMTLNVERQVHTGVERRTKTGNVRTVDLTPHTVETLKALKRQKAKAALSTGQPLCPYIFTLNNRTPITPTPIKIALDAITEKAGVHHLRIHDLRHSYATLRIMRGHAIGDVSLQMGHSNIGITLKTYTHYKPGQHKSQVAELDVMQPSAYQYATGRD